MTDVNHFEIVKAEASITEVVAKYLDTELKDIGTDTFEPDDKTCPFCGHKDCFRVNAQVDPGYYNCFSCTASGDVIKFVQEYVLKTDKPYEAVKLLAKDFEINLPKSKESPLQQIFNAAADYYANLLHVDGNKYTSLEGLTPLDYQTTVRKHNPDVLRDLGVGWSDGKLCSYLESLGFEKDLLEQSGLRSKKTKKDFLPSESFIYPHFVNGRASTFTFKNVSNDLSYQVRKENRLNSVLFMNQDDIKKYDQLVIVEGENDLISVREGGWKEGVIATNGQLSKEQIDYLGRAAAGKNIITAFDSDDAGDKYRSKISGLSVDSSSSAIRVDHIKVPDEYNDIDKYLKEGHTFEQALNSCIVRVVGGVEIEDGIVKHDGINVFEKDGCYFKVEMKNDEPVYKQISDFTIKLSHILMMDGGRTRIIRIKRKDGFTTGEIAIDAKVKVNLRSFKECMAHYSDGNFTGSENDIIEMWKYIYSVYGEELVELPKGVGEIKEGTFRGGWIFRNCFIDRYGQIHMPDERGIFWPNGKRDRVPGIRAQSNSEIMSTEVDHEIPALKILDTDEEYSDMIAFFLQNIIANFGSEVHGITTVGWCMANAFSGILFNHYKFFPFLFLYGKYGGGKSNILKWLLAIYGMQKDGGTTVSSLVSSSAGFERQLQYFHSLPLAIDEVRSDHETRSIYGKIRKWFNKEGRTLAARDDASKIQQRGVNANMAFGGEEVFEESATRSRVLPIRLFKMDDPRRETKNTYEQLMEAMGDGDLSAIGLHWIRMSRMMNPQDVISGIKDMKAELKERAPEVPMRTLDIYAMIAYFSNMLSQRFYRKDYDYLSDLVNMIREDTVDQSAGEIVGLFLEMLDGVLSSVDNKFTKEAMFTRDGKFFMWIPEIDRLMRKNGMEKAMDGNTLSRLAIKKALQEESYYINSVKTGPGQGSHGRRDYLVFDLAEAPDSMKNIAEASLRLPSA